MGSKYYQNDRVDDNIYKTDTKGNIGWKGTFVDGGIPLEMPNGDLYVVAYNTGYVYKLRAVY